MRIWRVRDARTRFSELLAASVKEGPQLVTRRGIDAAVLVSVEAWRRLQKAARPTLKELLLTDTPRAHIPVPRRDRRRRPAAG